MKKKPVNQFHVNPKFRAYGKARLDIAQRASGPEDWEKLWKKSAYPFPFTWGSRWKQCVEYRVDDFAAEVGFFIDILGLPVNAFDPDYAMFTSPAGDFYFSFVPVSEGELSTPSDAFRIQFMVENIQETALELERRGIPFEQWPQACEEGSSLYIGYFRTPHGMCIDLWGIVEPGESEHQTANGAEPENTQFIISEHPGDQEKQTKFLSAVEEPSAGESIDLNRTPDETESFEQETDSTVDALPAEEVDLADEVNELKYEYLDDM
jgi:catechol 2,3-dioxygenase-like lactoylglutathione lyase family enzyme